MIDHIGLAVSNMERAKAFYADALKPLGIEVLMEVTAEQTGADAHAGFGKDNKAFFWIGGGVKPKGGTHVAFTARTRADVDSFYRAALAAGGESVMLFDFKSQKWSVLVKELVGYPSWSHDGRFVYFLHLAQDFSVERVTVPGEKVEQVASLKGLQITGFYTFWFGLSPDDSPLVLKDAGTQEIVSMAWHEP